jgi:hypothetical protein
LRALLPVLMLASKNFLESRSVVLRLLKEFIGLSGAIFTQMCIAADDLLKEFVGLSVYFSTIRSR